MWFVNLEYCKANKLTTCTRQGMLRCERDKSYSFPFFIPNVNCLSCSYLWHLCKVKGELFFLVAIASTGMRPLSGGDSSGASIFPIFFLFRCVLHMHQSKRYQNSRGLESQVSNCSPLRKTNERMREKKSLNLGNWLWWSPSGGGRPGGNHEREIIVMCRISKVCESERDGECASERSRSEIAPGNVICFVIICQK